jgi:hypothetical protein
VTNDDKAALVMVASAIVMITMVAVVVAHFVIKFW